MQQPTGNCQLATLIYEVAVRAEYITQIYELGVLDCTWITLTLFI